MPLKTTNFQKNAHDIIADDAVGGVCELFEVEVLSWVLFGFEVKRFDLEIGLNLAGL